jgi:hypothetical protein
MAVWDTNDTYLDADAAMGSAQYDLVEGVGYAIMVKTRQAKGMTR